MKTRVNALGICAWLSMTLALAGTADANTLVETEMFAKDVAAGKLPPVDKRLPATPLLAKMDEPDMQIGKHGGTLNMLIGRSRDVRLMAVYGYARLVGFDRHLNLAPDLLLSIDAKDDKVFTLKLRRGHRWSDGQPFTAEDFRYFWDDVANNADLSPTGSARRCWPCRPRSNGNPRR